MVDVKLDGKEQLVTQVRNMMNNHKFTLIKQKRISIVCFE